VKHRGIGTAELQKLVYKRLSEAGVKVLDEVAENTKFPFVTIGETRSEDGGIKREASSYIIEELDIWSRAEGFKEIKEIADDIAEALRGNYPHDDWQFEFLGISDFETARLDDGITRHGAIKAEFLIFEK